jgi:hypothetical protein
VESKIHSQPRVASEIGAAHGMRIRKRATPLPKNDFMSARARMLPSVMTATCDTSVNTNVLRSERWNTGLASTFLKFWRPTKENWRLPAEELVRLRKTARRNGSATSSAM